MEVKSILVAHNNRPYRNGFCSGLNKQIFLDVKSASNGIEALWIILKFKPEIVILQHKLQYFTAFDIIKRTQKKGLNTKFIIAFDTDYDDSLILSCQSLMVSGALHPRDSFIDIDDCLRAVVDGQEFYSKHLQVQEVAKHLQVREVA